MRANTNSALLPEYLPQELKIKIFSNLGGEDQYWRDLFQRTVVPQLDLKDYFSRHVLSEIDEGWRIVGLYSSPCMECYNEGFRIPNPDCNECFRLEPCINCYWFNPDPYDLNDTCDCSENLELISWKHISAGTNDSVKYPRYYDFIRGEDWQAHLFRCAEIARFVNNSTLQQLEAFHEAYFPASIETASL